MDKVAHKPTVLFLKYHDVNIRPIPDEAERSLQVLPSLGILYLAAFTRKLGFPVKFLDANASRLSPEAFRSYLQQEQPEVIALTTMSAGWPSTVEAAKIIKEVLPKSLLIVGGPHLSIYPELCLSFSEFDIGIIGDGEETLREVLEKYSVGEPLNDIDGTVVRLGSEVKLNKPRAEFDSIDSYPFPAIDLLQRDLYHALTVESPFFTMITSRGCPFKCAFCSQIYNGVSGVRFRSPKSVVDEIELYVKEYGAKEIVFFDETFTLKKQRVFDICRLLKERNIKVSFDVRTRVDSVTEDMIKTLREVGGRRIHFGVEAGNPEILKRMCKGITHDQVRQAVSWAKKYGFETRGYFMIGYLGENFETFNDTVNLACELNLDYASFSVTTPLPATQLFREASELGLIDADYWKKYTLLQQSRQDFPVLETELWNEEKLHDMLKEAYTRFYLRPKFVMRRLSKIRSLNDIKELIKAAVIYKSI
ncbi:MAG: B12-binding domain-containing radical SAM protein [Candidatus Bruticola sp.]